MGFRIHSEVGLHLCRNHIAEVVLLAVELGSRGWLMIGESRRLGKDELPAKRLKAKEKRFVRISRIWPLCGLLVGQIAASGLCQKSNAETAALHGRVVDRSGAPVVGARVIIVRGAAETTGSSGPHGEFSIAAPAGSG